MATYISATQVTCPICETHIIEGQTRCDPLGFVATDHYQRMKWLPDASPRTATAAGAYTSPLFTST